GRAVLCPVNELITFIWSCYHRNGRAAHICAISACCTSGGRRGVRSNCHWTCRQSLNERLIPPRRALGIAHSPALRRSACHAVKDVVASTHVGGSGGRP